MGEFGLEPHPLSDEDMEDLNAGKEVEIAQRIYVQWKKGWKRDEDD